MGEGLWLASTDANALVRFAIAGDLVSARKFRLFACACARQVLPFIVVVDAASVLEVAEQLADDRLTDPSEWFAALDHAYDNRLRAADADRYLAGVLEATIHHNPSKGAEDAFENLRVFELNAFGPQATEYHLALVREVFGNPFQPIDFAPWRTDTAIALAGQMYESREFDAMPILADALQDAGCDNSDVLNHCRDANQVHVRGCWVVDGVLGKE
jgi:hypothetical protein